MKCFLFRVWLAELEIAGHACASHGYHYCPPEYDCFSDIRVTHSVLYSELEQAGVQLEEVAPCGQSVDNSFLKPISKETVSVFINRYTEKTPFFDESFLKSIGKE